METNVCVSFCFVPLQKRVCYQYPQRPQWNPECTWLTNWLPTPDLEASGLINLSVIPRTQFDSTHNSASLFLSVTQALCMSNKMAKQPAGSAA